MKGIKLLTSLVLAMMLLVGCASNANNNGNSDDTTVLTGKANGFGGVVVVEVTMENETITNVEVVEHSESAGISDAALAEVPARIVEANSTEVDITSGATYSSNAIIDAVNNALDPEKYPYEDESETEATVRQEVELGENGLYTGLGHVISVAQSTDGSHFSEAVTVALTLNKDKQIVNVKADVLEAMISWDATGVLENTESVIVESAIEASNTEWINAITAFETAVVGLNLEEVKALTDVNEQLVAATEEAINGALSLGATEGDTLGLGLINDYTYDQGSNSRDASSEKDGQAQMYATYVVVTVNQDTITSAMVDTSQAKVNFNTEGKITSDINAPVLSKNELGADYGMIVASGIGKEYYEQAFGVADFLQNKTVSDFVGAVDAESGRASDEDLKSSATIGLTTFVDAVEKAVISSK